MKKTIFNSILFFLISISDFAQAPQKINYQAVLRDASGQVLASQDLEIGITILQGSETGSEIFNETHSAVTNNFGLVNLQIGSVNTADMETIDWNDGPFFIQISVGGTVMGISQLLSVPYALHAVTVENDKTEDDDADPANELQVISISGNELSISDGNSVTLPDEVNDADADPTNEIQDISLSGTDLSISNGSTIDLSGLKDGTGTDNQKLFLNNNRLLSISNGNTVDLPYLLAEKDGDNTNELQTITKTGLNVTLSKNGGSFRDSILSETSVDEMVSNNGFQLTEEDFDIDSTNELQSIFRSGLTVTLDKNGGTFQDSILTETDVDVMVADNGYQLITDDLDIDSINEIQIISRSGLTVSLDKNGGSFQDSVLSENDVDIMVADNGYQLITDDLDIDSTNEIQLISRSGLIVNLNKNGGSYRDSILTESDVDVMVSNNGFQLVTNDADTDSTNEIQILKISNDTIFLEKGGAVKLPLEEEKRYVADSSYIKTGIRQWNSSVAYNISDEDTSLWNDKTYLSDLDNDTKIEVEENPDEDVLRMNVAGDEFFNADTTGVEFILPTSDNNSNLKVKKSNGTVVFGVDGSGLMNGDGSGLSNVKSLANTTGGNQLCQITKNYAWYQNIRSVTLETPSSGKCFVMASGYIRWESTGWDLLLSSILRNTDPNESWDAENEFFRYLNLSTDYNCTDSSDQYVGFAQHRCFNVGTGTQTFTLWGNKYTASAKVRVDDVNITVLFFPTAGTGSGTLKSTQLEAEQEQATEPFTSIPRRPDGGELRQRLDAMINEKRENEEVPDSGLIILQKSVEELKAENEKLKQEKGETDKRLSEIEKRIKLLMNSDKLNH